MSCLSMPYANICYTYYRKTEPMQSLQPPSSQNPLVLVDADIC